VVESFNSQDRIQCDGLTSSDKFRDFLACLRLFEVSCVVFFSILWQNVTQAFCNRIGAVSFPVDMIRSEIVVGLTCEVVCATFFTIKTRELDANRPDLDLSTTGGCVALLVAN
jgi:hypothetical protein